MVRTGLAGVPAELPTFSLEQDPIHRHKDVLAHTLAVVDKTSKNKMLRLAALSTTSASPGPERSADGGVTFHHHEVVGARMTRVRMEALRGRWRPVVRLVELHLTGTRLRPRLDGQGGAPLRCRDAGRLRDLLNELTRATARPAMPPRPQLARRMEELERRIDELRGQEELDSLRPDLSGNEVMDLSGSDLVPTWAGRWRSSWSCGSTRAGSARTRPGRGC